MARPSPKPPGGGGGGTGARGGGGCRCRRRRAARPRRLLAAPAPLAGALLPAAGLRGGSKALLSPCRLVFAPSRGGFPLPPTECPRNPVVPVLPHYAGHRARRLPAHPARELSRRPWCPSGGPSCSVWDWLRANCPQARPPSEGAAAALG